jgi:hypothetical protein
MLGQVATPPVSILNYEVLFKYREMYILVVE